jgi:hypothetical protein
MRGFVVTDTYGREHLRDELVNYLHFALTGETVSLNIPPAGAYLDAVLGGRELWPGDTPRLGEQFICCIAVEGFPTQSLPGILDCLDHLAIAYRWSTRMIYLDQHEALSELRKYRRKWKQQVRGFWTQVFKTQGGSVNEDALLMSSQADAAIADASSALVAFGYYTPVIVLMDSDRAMLTENARLIVREIQREGFTPVSRRSTRWKRGSARFLIILYRMCAGRWFIPPTSEVPSDRAGGSPSQGDDDATKTRREAWQNYYAQLAQLRRDRLTAAQSAMTADTSAGNRSQSIIPASAGGVAASPPVPAEPAQGFSGGPGAPPGSGGGAGFPGVYGTGVAGYPIYPLPNRHGGTAREAGLPGATGCNRRCGLPAGYSAGSDLALRGQGRHGDPRGDDRRGQQRRAWHDRRPGGRKRVRHRYRALSADPPGGQARRRL